MKDYDQAFEIVVGAEGGFTKDPDDSGNWTGGKVGVGKLLGTKFGISAASYPTEDIPGLSLERAKQIYAQDYWTMVRGAELRWPLNLLVFDAAVNCGIRMAVKLLQGSMGIAADGIFGPATLRAANSGSLVERCAQYCDARADYYRSLKTFPKYGNGWLLRLYRVLAAAAA